MENINNNEMELNGIGEDEIMQNTAELNGTGEDEIVQNTAEENDFLKSLDDEAVINGDSAAQFDESLLLAQGAMTAGVLLGAGEGLIKQFGHKDFALESSQKENVSKSFAPLFVKYGGELPPWVLQYKEEIMFTFAIGTLCFTSLAQIKGLKKADAEKVVNKTEKEGVSADAAASE